MIQSNTAGRALRKTTVKVVSVLHKPDSGTQGAACPCFQPPASQFYPRMEEV